MVKKGQFKVQQMAFMLMAVTLFFVLVGMFFLMIRFSNLKEGATILEERNAVLLASRIANSPEFSCGESFGIERVNCVDSDKVMVLKENIERYEGFWGVSSIEIRKIGYSEEVLCELETYEDCNTIRILGEEEEGTYVSTFVALCKKESEEGVGYDKCELARLFIGYENK